MARIALLFCPAPADWWRRPEQAPLARTAFDLWWQGAPTAAIGASASLSDYPAAPEHTFPAARFMFRLRLWLLLRHCRHVTLAGPDAGKLAARLARHGFAVDVLGGESAARKPASPAITTSSAYPALPLGIA